MGLKFNFFVIFQFLKMMDRSMVHELNGLSGSQFISNRSTFISTAYNQGDGELRKSRIQNLPSYKKEDMSSRVNFVVVFQSIQIERLSNEVEALRVALKDQERQMFNVQNYEVQIRELTQKCFAYEREREQYRDQIDKLNLVCERLYSQLEQMNLRFQGIDPSIKEKYKLEKERNQKLQDDIEKWKSRYTAMEASKSREMEDMRLMMQSQRKSMMDRQIKQLTLRFNSERQNLQKEIRKFRQALQSRDAELQRANGRISQLQIINQELRICQKTIDEYENKFAMVTQETMRLNEVLRNKNEQIERLNGNQAGFKRRIADLERKLRQAEEGGQKARMLQDQIREWKTRCSKIQDQNREYKQQLSKIPEFKQVIQQINNESDRLKDAVRQKMGEADEWKGRYQRIQSQLRDNKAQQQQKIPMLENKINQMSNQYDRLNNTLKTRAGQIQNWKNKNADMQKQLNRYVTVQQDKKNLENQLNNQVRQMNELQGNIRQLEGQAKRLGEVERQLSNQKGENQECRREIDRLNNAVRSATEKANNLQSKCANLQRDLKTFTQIQEELRIYKQKQINLTKQIDRINGIITEKIKQIQTLKQVFQRFEGRLNQYQGMEKKLMDSVNQTQKLIHDLDQSRKQSGFLQDKLIASQGQSKKLQNDVFILAQEKQQVVKLINTRTQELDQAKMQNAQLQGQVGQLRQKQAKLREVEEQLRISDSKLVELDKRYKSEQNRGKQIGLQLEQLNGELTKIKREGMMSPKFKEQFFELKSQTQQRDRQFRSLQQRIQTCEGIIKKLKQVVSRQDQVTRKNTQKYGAILKQFDISFQAMKKMFELQNQIMKLNEDNLQLQGKVRIMAVENETFKKSFSGSGVWTSEKDLNSPINNIDFKKSDPIIGQFDMPMAKKTSNSYSNMVVSNVRPANVSPSNANSSNMNYNYVSTTSVSSGGSDTNIGGGFGGGMGTGFGGGSLGRGVGGMGVGGMSTGMSTGVSGTMTSASRGMSGDMSTGISGVGMSGVGMSGAGSYGGMTGGMSGASGSSNNYGFSFPNTSSQNSSRQESSFVNFQSFNKKSPLPGTGGNTTTNLQFRSSNSREY